MLILVIKSVLGGEPSGATYKSRDDSRVIPSPRGNPHHPAEHTQKEEYCLEGDEHSSDGDKRAFWVRLRRPAICRRAVLDCQHFSNCTRALNTFCHNALENLVKT